MSSLCHGEGVLWFSYDDVGNRSFYYSTEENIVRTRVVKTITEARELWKKDEADLRWLGIPHDGFGSCRDFLI